jgi:ABC-2 type transport system permease protein
MRIIHLALKDLSQIFRDKRSLMFLVAMPIIFTLFMGFAYKSGDNKDSSKDNRLPLGWVNNDPQGLLSGNLFDLLSRSNSIKLVQLTAANVDDAVRNGEVAGALIVPAGFSDQLSGDPGKTRANGDLKQLTLVADLNSPKGQSLFQLLRTPLTQVMSSVEIALLSAKATGRLGDTVEAGLAFHAAAQTWAQTDTATLVKVKMAVSQSQKAWYGDNPYNQASPGILVMFAIFGLVTSGQILVQERKSRTLQRMITTSMHAWQIVAGHMLAMFAVVFVQVALLVVFGQFVLGVNYALAPLGILLLSVALGLWIASMGLLIGVIVKNDSQVTLLSLMAMFIFSALGGLWFPLEVSSGSYAAIGKLLPSAWAMTGYQNILIRGLGTGSIWLPALALLGYTVGFFALAVWRFRKMDV